MNVLFLTNIPSPYRVDFFNELGKRCNLTVTYELKVLKTVDSRWLSNKANQFEEIYLKGIKARTGTAFSLEVIKYIKNKKFDTIIVGEYSTPTGMLAISYMKLKKIPYILNCDGGIIKDDKFIKYKIKKFFISGAEKYLSTADETDKYLIHYGAKKEKIYRYSFTSMKDKEILQNIVSEEDKIKLKKELGIKEENAIISVGQFIHRKGFDILLKSCRKINKNAGIYIIGNKPTQEYLNIKNELKLNNVHFIDFKGKEELLKYYKAADIFVLPTRKDVWGLVINEAMACGLPIVTTNKCVSGLELIENGKNGFIIPVENVEGLSNKINIILNDKTLRLEMAKNNLQKIKKYTIENMAEEHLDILKNNRSD